MAQQQGAQSVATASSAAQPTQPALPQRPSSLAVGSTTSADGLVSTEAQAHARRERQLQQHRSSVYGTGYGTSPYSRYGSSLYGNGLGYGGYGGSMYGNSMYGGAYGGYGGYRPGASGMGMGIPNGEAPGSLMNAYSQSTQATFQVIESIVGAVIGMAQMLESTYVATYSSFFAMVSVADQFASLRTSLAQVLGIYAILRWIRTFLANLTGRPPPADATSLTPSNFFAFTGEAQFDPQGRPLVPRPSKKPLLMFALAVFGLPYLMAKLIRRNIVQPPSDTPTPSHELQTANNALSPTSMAQVEFFQALYDYSPANPQSGVDLSVKKGEPVAVLSRLDPRGSASEWWHCRTRAGQIGYLPGVYLEPFKPNLAALAAGTAGSQPQSADSTRANTILTNSTDAQPVSRVDSLVREAEKVLREQVSARKGKKAAPIPA